MPYLLLFSDRGNKSYTSLTILGQFGTFLVTFRSFCPGLRCYHCSAECFDNPQPVNFITGLRGAVFCKVEGICSFRSLLELWLPYHILSRGACILGGGIATIAQRTQNGFKKILQVWLYFSTTLPFIELRTRL